MTSRPRSAAARARTQDARDRRTLLINIGFVVVIAAALLLLLVAWGAGWYGEHLTSAATVNGETITKDAFAKQKAINTFDADYQGRQIRTLLAAGHLRPADAETRQAVIGQRLSQVDTASLEQLVDGVIMAKLAPDQGVTVTDADVDAQITTMATTPELRHAWMIAVAPTLAAGETSATDAEKAAAKAAAEAALADLRAGKDWDSVARSVSTDATKDQAGDLSFVDKSSTLDAPFSAAIMAAAKDTPTDVVEGDDGTFRIGRVTEILAPAVDGTLVSQAQDAGISADDFRAAVRRDVLRSKLNDAIVAQRLAPGPQRDVSEIFIQEGQSETGPQAIRVRHILYAPNGDLQGATTLAADDPAWAKAEATANATYAKLKADPSQFDAIAHAESNDTSTSPVGGKLPYFSADDPIDPAFWAAVSAPGLQPGQLLAPVRSQYGWHVIQVMHFPTDADWAAKLKTQIDAGTLTFADAARDNSDKSDEADGGKVGWVGKGQLDPVQEAAIFAAPIGKVSDPLTVPGEGIYMYQVSKEETRAPEGEQKANLEQTAFSIWYSRLKGDYDIVRDPAITGATGG
jgi:parvulin-like peptidyl-prolyl isomerase